MLMFMPSESRWVPAGGVGPRAGTWADIALDLQLDRTAVHELQ
jgi:hypothetical protein